MARERCFGTSRWIGLLLALGLATGAGASPLSSSVAVVPPEPTSSDGVVLEIEYTFPTTGYVFSESVLDFVAPDEIRVAVYVSAPAPDEPVLFVPTGLATDVALGRLGPGTYSFQVDLWEAPRGPLPVLERTDTVTGGFEVVPEPGTALLVALGLAGLARLSGGRDRLHRARYAARAARPRPGP